MIDTTASTERNWEHRWIEFRGTTPFVLTIRHDLKREQEQRNNMIANRGRFPVSTI